MLRASLILTAILSFCSPDETVSSQTETTDVWVLQSVNDEAITERITLEFPEEGRISGRAPCNRYFATQSAPLPWFEIGDIGATKVACPALKQEQEYFENLRIMSSVEVIGDTLVLRSVTGFEVVMVYKKD
ncbi:META domain-containing protein [Amylibacter sp. SFDW26]|uniref:META domain-containing protein n=1 Tax=Amylibacter sp. SFDW26 TaxID=2652722 RepID=UPI0012628655|nr:META domain-containing protein [Amylibacter sp. SFDW26]KAB7614816.1 META domain-containing protein [Amylibacter sp. SFDW26]